MVQSRKIKPFDNCLALDGYHCQTNSLAKIFHFYRHHISEEMLLGLGAGIGFIYWHQKGTYPFVGARGNNKEFFNDIGKRTGVEIKVNSTSSQKKAEKTLLEKMEKQEPVMLFGDMGYLPWFDFPEDYHFGGHTFTICGYDDQETFLASDIDPNVSGLKKGFYYDISAEQLKNARDSKYKPFPPKNTYLDFDFSSFREPGQEEIYSAILQNTEALLEPPISNLGIKGIRKTADEILKWKKMFDDRIFRLNLFTLYVYIEIGGTGGGSFRYMYSRFLEEAAGITGNDRLLDASKMVYKTGSIFSQIGMLFKDAEDVPDLDDRVSKAKELYIEAADNEEKAFSFLRESIT
jgi:hypothetical protein